MVELEILDEVAKMIDPGMLTRTVRQENQPVVPALQCRKYLMENADEVKEAIEPKRGRQL